ncbi:hypothetical protein SRABI126_04788 [Pedobacter sp. Bi126]|nr:hypothetical protein SRABI126_04788 [Pedobacter sp. Bi126]
MVLDIKRSHLRFKATRFVLIKHKYSEKTL